MLCRFCNHEIEDDVVICPECGKRLEEENPIAKTEIEAEEVIQEKVPFSLKLVSFLVPLVGIILYFLKKKDNEREAKACIKAAIISIAISVISSIVLMVATVALAFAATKDNAVINSGIQYEETLSTEDGDIADVGISESSGSDIYVPPIE